MEKPLPSPPPAPLATTPTGLRAFERFPVDWEALVQCSDWGSAERIAAANVSRGGMFLRTERRLEPGARVKIVMRLPEGADVVLLASVRHGQSGGVGVEVDATHRNELLALVEIARLRQGKPPTPPSSEHATTSAPAAGRRRVAFPRGNTCPIVGIDFGTSASGLAVGVNDAVYSVPDTVGRLRSPSVVVYREKAGAPVVGWDALKLQRAAQERAIGAVKPLIGRPFSDPLVSRYLSRSPLEGFSGDGSVLQFDLGHTRVDVVQLTAHLLRHLKQTRQEQVGIPIEQAVLAHPITFSRTQVDALHRAAEIAGISVISTVPEALASARAMGLGQAETQIVAVCDFGGGSFEMSVLEIGARTYGVLASASDAQLGGNDFDDHLTAAVAEAVERRCARTIEIGSAQWQHLRLRCERAKRRLASDEATAIELPACNADSAEAGDRQQINRASYERICQPLIEGVLQLCNGALSEAGLEPRQVDEVVLTGGMFHLPFVRRALEGLFERSLTEQSRHDDLVALGAGLTAAQMVGHSAQQIRR
jgi:molecular chaperone DnaK